MRARKKTDADELLVVPKARAAEPGKAGRERGPGGEAAHAAPFDQQAFEAARQRFGAAHDPEEKRRILAEVQRRFGNAKAALLVREARSEDDLPAVMVGDSRKQKA